MMMNEKASRTDTDGTYSQSLISGTEQSMRSSHNPDQKQPEMPALPATDDAEAETEIEVKAVMQNSLEFSHHMSQTKQPVNNMTLSFGMQNNFMATSPVSSNNQVEEQKLGDAGYEREEAFHGSMISIKDIAQVSDEVPASPATTQKQQGIKETYFQ